MLRHILHDLEWAIAFAFVTLILFVIIALITIKPAIATITETNLTPGQVHCRSEQILTDETGHKWQVMLFTQVHSPSIASLNLRLSGISSSLKIQSRKPLIIQTPSDRYEVTDIFLEEPPLPSIGQYDLQNVFPQLPTEELILKLPLENSTYIRLSIPQEVVKEWQEVAAKNPGTSPKLPSGFQLAC
ncbi:MAG: hypothetical protein Tsb0014_15630 [Pleurocapsa sp.]